MGVHIRRSVQCAFFTIPAIAKQLINEVDISKFKLVIEPSAGAGSFSRQINGCLAFDINPKHPTIIKQDFLQWSYDGPINRRDILCVGNPPFGTNGSLAHAFIKKCATIADTIAFILPLSYKKDSIKARVPKNYHLVKQIDIPLENALLGGKPQEVPVIFQIWENKYAPRAQTEHVMPIGFSYVHKSESDFCYRRVGVCAGRASTELAKSETAHYYIKLADVSILDQVIVKLNAIKWTHNNTVAQRSISKNELNAELNNIIHSLS